MYRVNSFLTEEECIELQKIVLDKTDTVTCYSSKKTFVIKDIPMCNRFKKRLLSVMPKYDDSNNFELCDINTFVHYCHYKTGSYFGIHTGKPVDSNLKIFNQIKEKDRKSHNILDRFKLLLYLNTPEKGGDTLFYNDQNEVFKTTKVKAGDAIIFDMTLKHSVTKIEKGEKFIMSFRVQYKRK